MWPNPQFPTDLVTFTDEILIGKLHFLCSMPYVYLQQVAVITTSYDTFQRSYMKAFEPKTVYNIKYNIKYKVLHLPKNF